MPTLIIGVDPGARETGLVVRVGGDLLEHATLEHPPLADVAVRPAVIDDLLTAVEALAWRHPPDGVAVEDVIGRWRRGAGARGAATDPVPVLATAALAGAVVAWARGLELYAAVVRPARAGQDIPAAYPVELHDPHGCGRSGSCSPACASQGGKRRHERAAWDIAGRGAYELRLAAAR